MSISPNSIPPTNRKCNVCGSSESRYEKYLLTCRQCQRSYHHNSAGCYTPKILHEELIVLAKRSESAGKVEIDWTCRWCKKGKTRVKSKAIMDAGSSKLTVREQETRSNKSAGNVRSTVVNLLSSDDEESTSIRPEDKGKLPETSVATNSSRRQGPYSIGGKKAGPLQPSAGLEDSKGVPRNVEPAVLPPIITDNKIDTQNVAMNEEIVVVEPYRTREKGSRAGRTPTDGVPDPMRIYRDRGKSFQSNTPEALSAQPTEVPADSRAGSLFSDASTEVDITIPSRSISLSPVGSPWDEVEEQPEPEPGVYVFELPGVSVTIKLRIDDAVRRSRQHIHNRDGRQEFEEEEDDLIFKFGRLKEALSSTSVATPDAKIRQPRKEQAKQLNKFNKALGQRSFAFDAEPWLREEYGRDLHGRLLRTAHNVRHSDHAI